MVGGGLHGQIKVILIKQSVCLSRIEAHKNQIKCLLFHYKYPNILLSKILKIETTVDLLIMKFNRAVNVFHYKFQSNTAFWLKRS